MALLSIWGFMVVFSQVAMCPQFLYRWNLLCRNRKMSPYIYTSILVGFAIHTMSSDLIYYYANLNTNDDDHSRALAIFFGAYKLPIGIFSK